MNKSIQIIKSTILIVLYIIVLRLYLFNDLNKHLPGIIADSFWLTSISTLFIIFLLRNTGLKLHAAYFHIRKPELSTSIYKIIGIPVFKKIIEKSPLPVSTLKMSLNNRSRSAILELEHQMQYAETVHVFGFLLVLALTLGFAWQRDARFLFWFTVFNIIMNLYPVLLQRYNRNRIRVALEKIAIKKQTSVK
ncbi:MAG TPA: hypothetical protein PLP19_05800 [bacterium]|nr:hypothetical protein [bacterium]HPN42981.1 hypothetical protein [bacterium]